MRPQGSSINLEDLHETRSEVASSFLEMGSHDRRASGRDDETDADDEDEADERENEGSDENDDEDERGGENEADDENEDEAEDGSEDENDTRARQKPKKKGFFGRMFDAGKSLLRVGRLLSRKALEVYLKG